MTERDDRDFGEAPSPPDPFDPSTREFPAIEPEEERDPGRPFEPPGHEDEVPVEEAEAVEVATDERRRLEAERIEQRHEAVSMDTSTFMAIPAPTPTIPFVPPD